jgi:hypothetical protein
MVYPSYSDSQIHTRFDKKKTATTSTSIRPHPWTLRYQIHITFCGDGAKRSSLQSERLNTALQTALETWRIRFGDMIISGCLDVRIRPRPCKTQHWAQGMELTTNGGLRFARDGIQHLGEHAFARGQKRKGEKIPNGLLQGRVSFVYVSCSAFRPSLVFICPTVRAHTHYWW